MGVIRVSKAVGRSRLVHLVGGMKAYLISRESDLVSKCAFVELGGGG